MDTIPINAITINDELDKDMKTKYYTISGKVGNREYYRMGHFEDKGNAEEFGKTLLVPIE